MIGEVLSIGDELTSGQRLDTNTQWLSQQLGDLGVRVERHATVADDLPALTDAVKQAIDRADFFAITGGLGPTADDLTREAIAAAVGVPLRRDEGLVEEIRQMFVSRGRTMPDRNARQADLPEGASAIPNPTGTAPGVQISVERPGRPPCRLFALPGVPAEMHRMWAATVAPAISAAMPEPRVIVHHCLKCFGAGESHIEAMLPDLIARGREPLVGITASGATITLRVTASGADEAEARAAMAPTIETIRSTLGQLVYGEGDEQLQDTVARLLSTRRHDNSPAFLETAESWTGGLVAHWMAESDHPACSSQINSAIGVAPSGVEAVKNRAQEVLRLGETADFALVTGYPDDGDPQRVAAAVAWPDGVRGEAWTILGDPSIVRVRIAKHALDLLRRVLLESGR